MNGRQLGEYFLKELLTETSLSRTWLARQDPVERSVLLEELQSNRMPDREAFLANACAKSAVDHPLIGSVYEAVSEPEACYFTHELPSGASLEKRQKSGLACKPVLLASLLQKIAEACKHHESLGQATLPLRLAHIHLDNQTLIRMENLAISGKRPEDQSTQDISRLGQDLLALVEEGQPGTSRILTLLAWMRGENLQTALTWKQVQDLSAQLIKNVSLSMTPNLAPEPEPKLWQKLLRLLKERGHPAQY